MKNWYQFFTRGEELVPICHGFHTNISQMCEDYARSKKHIAFMRILHIDKIHPNSFAFLAHLSRRLIGELIVYPWIRRPSYVVRPSVVRRRPQCSNIFFSETAWPIKAKFYVEPPWVGGTIFCSRHLGHMTKMAATPIYGKNPSKIFFSRTGGPIFTKLGM